MNRKSIVLAFVFIAPLISSVCEAEINTSHNAVLTKKKYSVFKNCKKVVDISNYRQILREKNSGLFINPFQEKNCFPISFHIKEKNEFLKFLIDESDGSFDWKLNSYAESEYNKYVNQIQLNDGRTVQLMRFTENDFMKKILLDSKKYREVLLNYEEFLFLHELFHVEQANLDKDIKGNIKETLSDVASIIVLSSENNLSKEQSIALGNELYRLREQRAISARSGHHFNKIMFNMFLFYLKKDNLPITVNSLKEALIMAKEITTNYKQSELLSKATYIYDENTTVEKKSKKIDFENNIRTMNIKE